MKKKYINADFAYDGSDCPPTQEENIKKRAKLICIVGNSGVGKNEVARIINKKFGLESVVSYTTRPMREDEVDGADYHFVKESPKDKSTLLEYCKFGDYEYWSDLNDLKSDAYTFIVEEEGLRYLRNHKFTDVRLFVINIERPIKMIINSGVSVERILRDQDRDELRDEEYDIRIYNKYNTLDELEREIRFAWIANFLMKTIYISIPVTNSIDLDADEGNKTLPIKNRIKDIRKTLMEKYPDSRTISPLELVPLDPYLRYSDYLMQDIKTIMDDVDLVYFCKGWELSRGCNMEHKTCEIYNIPIEIE